MVNPSSIAQSSSPWNAPEDQDGELSSWTRFIFNNIVIPAGCVFLMMLFFGVLEALFSREDRSSSSGNTGSSVVNHFHVPPNSAGKHFLKLEQYLFILDIMLLLDSNQTSVNSLAIINYSSFSL